MKVASIPPDREMLVGGAMLAKLLFSGSVVRNIYSLITSKT